MILLKYWYKYTNKNKYRDIKEQMLLKRKKSQLLPSFTYKLDEISGYIKNEKVLNFKHSGHIGDIIYALPVIKELSKTHICNLFIQVNKPIDKHAYKHTAGNVFINKAIYDKLTPLLKSVEYISEVNILENQKIHIDFDLFREFPFDLNFISFRWFFHLTGIQTDLSEPFLKIEPHPSIKNKIVIVRSFRVRNPFVDYSFLAKFDNLLFIGLKDEYEDLKKLVPNLEFYDVKDFYEMAQIIKSSKIFIGNQSFAYSLAEAIKTPRLLEAYSDFPVVHPIGKNAYDFYFQLHFEQLFNKLNTL
ncbi:hypothetical protein [Flavobacterium sp.]|uniref:hypothetical protein n=2 Tax=Flavobacterium TaxID=237 RepID=UPI0037521C17